MEILKPTRRQRVNGNKKGPGLAGIEGGRTKQGLDRNHSLDCPNRLVQLATILHPTGAVIRTTLYNMVVFLLAVIVAALIVAIPIIRQRIKLGVYARSALSRGELPFAGNPAGIAQSPSPMKQFLVVILPDGTVVNPIGANQF